ncbi:MAG: NPCBM/NEW2 domain-containing protein [Planctomycetes bacterium]|nr:NPCBM/NEW2 domain-containing protein [Planctomycetota bacterium]
MPVRVGLIFGMLAALTSAAAAQVEPPAFDVLLADGTSAGGPVRTLSDESVELGRDSPHRFSTDEIVRLDARGRLEGAVDGRAALVLLANGDRVALDAETIEIDEAVLTGRWFRFTAWKPLRIPLETVRGVILRQPLAESERTRLLNTLGSSVESRGSRARSGVRGSGAFRHSTLDSQPSTDDEPAERTDVLVLMNGDRLPGEFRGLDRELVALGGAVESVPRSGVRAIRFNPALVSLPQAEGRRQLVSLEDGSRLTTRNLRLGNDGTLSFDVLYGQAYSVPLSRVVAIRVLGGRIEHLSDLQPADYIHVPYLSQHWPLQRDRNVLGGPLRLGQREFPRGLGMHSRSHATYNLDGRYERLLATIGVDAAAGQQGSVVFAVQVDGKRVFESDVRRAGDEPVSLPTIDLRGAKRLTLVAEFGPLGDIQDYANWCDAVLVRSEPEP